MLILLLLQGVIDVELERAWSAAGVDPAPIADDADFLRRASLDVVGRIPTLEEAEAFLADARPDKRARVVDALLERPEFARNWSRIWSAAILGVGEVRMQADVASKLPTALEGFFAANLPLDEIARTVVTWRTPDPKGGDGLSIFYKELFIRADGERAQFLAGRVARAFLGIQIQCARCHDHPFDRWTQEQFYGMAAFFAGTMHRENGVGDRPPGFVKGLAIPGTRALFAPAWLDSKVGPRPGEVLRSAFARILVDDGQFARAAVNRVWANFFGRGFVTPLDGFGERRTPAHARLLEVLATELRVRRFDLKWLIREICASRAYGLSARTGARDPEKEALHALAAVRPLRPEQIVDSLYTATRFGDEARRDGYLRQYRATLGYAHGQPGTAFESGIPVALLRLNGELLSKALAASPEEEDVDRLYMRALCRRPRPEEREACRGLSGKDVLAALLNTSEFILAR